MIYLDKIICNVIRIRLVLGCFVWKDDAFN